MQRSPSPDFSFADLVDIWRRRRVVVVGFFLTTILIALGGSLIWPKRYRSESRLLVRVGRENATLDPTASVGSAAVFAMPTSREEEIASIVDILRSRDIIERVVESVGAERLVRSGWSFMPEPAELDARGRDELIEALGDDVIVENVKGSNIVRIEYRAFDPETAQAVVSALVDVYLADHVKFNRSRGAVEFLREQEQRQSNVLSDWENQLVQLKASTGLIDVEAQRQVLVQQLGSLEDESFRVKQNLTAARKEVDELRDDLAELPETQLSERQLGVADQGTDGMRGQFYALRLREQELLAQHSAAHPEVQEIRRQVEAARKILEQEERTLVVSTEAPNRAYEETNMKLLDAERLLATLLAREGKLDEQISDLKQRIATLNRNALAVAQLERKVQINDAEYRRYAANLEQAMIENALEEGKISNLSVVQTPSLEVKEVSPDLALNTVLGVFAGALGGVALALLLERCDGRLHTAKQLEQELNLRVLGSVSRLARKDQPVAARN